MEKPICNLQLKEPPNALSSFKIKSSLDQAYTIAKLYNLKQVEQKISFEFVGEVIYTSTIEYPVLSVITLLSFLGVIR